jgi:hypothetical protein
VPDLRRRDRADLVDEQIGAAPEQGRRGQAL